MHGHLNIKSYTSFVSNAKCCGKFCVYRIQVRNVALHSLLKSSFMNVYVKQETGNFSRYL